MEGETQCKPSKTPISDTLVDNTTYIPVLNELKKIKHVQRRKMYCKWDNTSKYTSRRRMPNNNDTVVKVVEIKPEFYAESHGRQLLQIIDSCMNGKVVLK